jgi:hypothetical protein
MHVYSRCDFQQVMRLLLTTKVNILNFMDMYPDRFPKILSPRRVIGMLQSLFRSVAINLHLCLTISRISSL